MRAGVLVPDPAMNSARAAMLFDDIILVNATLKQKARAMVRAGVLKLAETTVSDKCGEALQGCYLGLYHRDKTEEAKAILEELKRAEVVPASAAVPKPES